MSRFFFVCTMLAMFLIISVFKIYVRKLPNNLDQPLRIIGTNQHISIPLTDIRKLLLVSLITHKLGGWMINSKVRVFEVS